MSSHFEMSCNRVKTFTLTSCVKKQKCPGNEVAAKICQFQCLANLVWKVSSLHSIGCVLFLNIANSTLKQNRVCFFRKVTDCRPNPKKEFLHGIFKDFPEKFDKFILYLKKVYLKELSVVAASAINKNLSKVWCDIIMFILIICK